MSEEVDVAYLLKRGRTEEARKLIEDAKLHSYTNDFPAFITQMLDEYGLKKKDVVARSGLSQDYLYKLLRGAKTTTERDYILAICLAIGMNLPQTQHALKIYGMPTLDQRDNRSCIIYYGIQDHKSRLAIDEQLEKVGLNPIKISPDMESSTIIITGGVENTLETSVPAGTDIPGGKHDIDSGDFPIGTLSVETLYRILCELPKEQLEKFLPEVSTDSIEESKEVLDRIREGHLLDDLKSQGCIIGHDHVYKEIDRKTGAIRNGNAPFDFAYWGVITLEAENGEKFYVQATYDTFGTIFCIMDEENYLASRVDKNEAAPDLDIFIPDHVIESGMPFIKNDGMVMTAELNIPEKPEVEVNVLEEYEDLSDATASKLFPYFLALEKATDDTTRVTMESVDDTRNYRIRYGFGISGGKAESYLEAFNDVNPERSEYYQIRENLDGTRRFTASHKSYYMRIELGQIYEIYFGKAAPEEYYIDVKDLSELPDEFAGTRYTFTELLRYLHDALGKEEGIPTVDEKEILRVQLKSERQQVGRCETQGKPDEAVQHLKNTLKLIDQLEAMGENLLPERIINTMELYPYAEEMTPEARTAREKIAGSNEQLIQMIQSGKEVYDAPVCMAELYLQMSGDVERAGNLEKAKQYALDALNLTDLSPLQRKCEKIWAFRACMRYAYLIDVSEPERSLEYTERAMDIADEYGFAEEEYFIIEAVYAYYNHGWVLWNRLGNQEAIIYYGHALKLLERKANIWKDNKELFANMQHVANGVLEFYEGTGQTEPAARLRERMKRYGILL